MHVTFLMQDTGAVYGAERATIDLAKGLRTSGVVDADVLLIHEGRLGLRHSGLQDALREAAIPLSLVQATRPFSLKLVESIRRRLSESQTDLLHTIGYKANVHGGLASKWGILWPQVSTVHGWLYRPRLKEQFYGWLDLQAYRRCSKVVVLSRHYERLLLEKGVGREKVVRIPSGLDRARPDSCEEAAGARKGGEPFTVGMFGRLSEEKRHDLFLRAFNRARVTCPELRGIVAGEGGMLERIQRQVAELGLSQQLRLVGYVDVDSFMSQVDAMVICSKMENLPYSVLEAMSWCRPVVATSVGGLPDLVEDGTSGFLVPANDVDALAERIYCLASNPEKAAAMGLAGREVLEKEFSLAETVARHIDMYSGLLSVSSGVRQ